MVNLRADPGRKQFGEGLRKNVLEEVTKERIRQIERWGLDDHHQDVTEFVDLIGQRCTAILYDDTGDPVRSIPIDTPGRRWCSSRLWLWQA